MNHFMRAHGYLPGPTQRPVVAGFLSGIVALAPSLVLGWYTTALASDAKAIGIHPALAAIIVAASAALAGGLYGRIFMRAANDRRGVGSLESGSAFCSGCSGRARSCTG